jgi:pilus assembly protein Flp/PilA
LSLTEADPEQGSSQTVVQKETTMTKLFARFAKNESGATAIEYGLIAALIAVVAIAGMNLVGSALNGILGRIATALGGA